MKEILPSEIEGMLPPNTLDTNYKGSVYIAQLLEAGIDADDIIVVRDGNSLVNIDKDVHSVRQRTHFSTTDTTYIEVRLNKHSIYDSMPEGTFHAPLFPGKTKDREMMLEEIKRHNQEEFAIRKFFSVFENEIDRQVAHIHQLEFMYDKKQTHDNYIALFSSLLPIVQSMSKRSALLLLQLLPNIHRIRNSIDEVAKAMSYILDVPIVISENKVIREIKASHTTRLSRMRLGIDSVNVGVLNDAHTDLFIHVGDIDAGQVIRFLKGNDLYEVVHKLSDVFLGADKMIELKISVLEHQRKAQLFSPKNEYPNYLGINTYL